MKPRRVTDMELHFLQGEPVYFTCDAARGDAVEDVDGQRVYTLHPSPDVVETIIVEDPATRIRYVRLVERPADQIGKGEAPRGFRAVPPAVPRACNLLILRRTYWNRAVPPSPAVQAK